MNRSLVLKLSLAFLGVSILGVVLAVVFARWATFREFNRLVLDQTQENFVADASDYYRSQGSWSGVGPYFAQLAKPSPAEVLAGDEGQPLPLPPPLDSHGQPPPERYVFAVADTNGNIVLPAGPYEMGAPVAAAELAAGSGIYVDGELVGTAIATGEPPPMAPQELGYLARTNRAALYAGLAAILIALGVGVLLARTLTRPLRELTAATTTLASGELGQQVPVRSRDELGQLAQSFNQMSADLARANELQQQMTADIAHDLRTPLTVMSGYLEALRDGVLQPSPERFETMYQESMQLRRLVDDLRTLSLADAGALSLNLQPVSPALVLEQLASLYGPQAEGQGIEFGVQLEPDVPDIEADPDRLGRVLSNLVSNALRHTPAGGRVTLEAKTSSESVLLTVQDTGEGIPAEQLPYVFDRFYRGAQGRATDTGETGLGLAIAKSLVELHGGTISVRSAPDQGSSFTVALPVK